MWLNPRGQGKKDEAAEWGWSCLHPKQEVTGSSEELNISLHDQK